MYYDIAASQFIRGGIEPLNHFLLTRLALITLKPYSVNFFSVMFFTTMLTYFVRSLALCGLATDRSGDQLLAGWLIANVVQSAMFDLREDIDHKINRLPVSYFDRNQQGNILSRVTNDVDAVSGAMQQALIGIVNAILGILVAVSMMFYINVKMALLSLIMIPASFLISRFIVKVSQKYFQGMQNALGDLNGFAQENMTGFSVLKVYGREKQTLEDFKKVNYSVRSYGNLANRGLDRFYRIHFPRVVLLYALCFRLYDVSQSSGVGQTDSRSLGC